MSARGRLLFLALLALAIPACGGSSPGEVAEVEGTILWHKKPLPNVQVQFHPDNSRGTVGPRSCAVTDSQGHFVLAFDDGRPGAVVGKHRVVLIETDETVRGGKGNDHGGVAGSRQNRTPHQVLGPAYSSLASTPLNREVIPGKQTINCELP